MPNPAGLLERGLEELGLPSSGPLSQALGRYIARIELRNPAWGLVGASGDELVIKHILDSLAPAALIAELLRRTEPPRRPALADLGTGAGLPGVPLALALPGADVALIDRMTRRIRFLEELVDELPLPNVRIIETQVEHARGAYDIVVFRAFRPFERKLFKRVFALCAPDGAVVAYKGKIEKARAELAAIEGLYAQAEIHPLKVPFLEDERCAVLLRPAPRT